MKKNFFKPKCEVYLGNVIIIILCLVSVFLTSAKEIKTLKIEENGFKYFIVENENNNHRTILALNGDTIVNADTYISCHGNDKLAGLFVYAQIQSKRNKFTFKEFIYNIAGDCISKFEMDNSYANFNLASSGKIYYNYRIEKKNKEFHGILDMYGNPIIEAKYKKWLSYDDSLDKFYFEQGKNKKRKYLNVKLPAYNYDSICENSQKLMVASMKISPERKIIPHYDDIFWTKIREGGVCGAIDALGKMIIPLSRGYEIIEFTSLNDGLACFRVQKNRSVGICDLNGKEIIPLTYIIHTPAHRL